MLLDSFAWVEYFKGTVIGEKVGQWIEQGNASTSVLSLAEVGAWAIRSNEPPAGVWASMKENSRILPINDMIAENAARLYDEIRRNDKTFGMVDALIYATAQLHGFRVVTGDPHFQGLPEVEFLE